MTSDPTVMYNMRDPTVGSSRIVIAGGATLRVIACGDLDLVMNARTDFLVRLTSVLLVEGLSFNIFSLHWGQRNGRMVLDKQGTHVFDGQLSRASPTLCFCRCYCVASRFWFSPFREL
ncbi:unnamed protein product [Pylaiella littoralis]